MSEGVNGDTMPPLAIAQNVGAREMDVALAVLTARAEALEKSVSQNTVRTDRAVSRCTALVLVFAGLIGAGGVWSQVRLEREIAEIGAAARSVASELKRVDRRSARMQTSLNKLIASTVSTTSP